MGNVKIKDSYVGNGQPVFIIAEIGINHNGSIETTKQLIDQAVICGCNAVKFQKRTPELCVPEEQKYTLRETPWGTMTYIDYKRKIEFGAEEFKIIDDYCNEKGIVWFASCWDVPSVDFIETFNPPAYKAASASLTDIELLKAMKATGKPLIISTGMSTLEEITSAIEILGKDNLLIAHSTSAYPCPVDELNLNMIISLKNMYPDIPIGYSGHETGLTTTVVAVALGATFVERHFTLDRAMWGTDHPASMEPVGMQRLVRDIRDTEKALGDGIKKVYDSEKESIKKLRRITQEVLLGKKFANDFTENPATLVNSNTRQKWTMSKTIKVMFIVGTSNQTTMMHKIANELPDHYDCYFSNFYGDGIAKFMKEQNMLEVTIIGNAMCKANEIYFKEHGLQNDYRAEKNDYDLVFSTNDTYVPKNLQGKKMILVQEGILEPVDWRFHTAKLLGLPRLLADTSMMGLSDDYDYFCVFSEGYKKEFIKRGVKAEKIKVTSAPNFDDLDKHYQNDFPHRNYVLAITCNHRETRRADDRIGFIRKVKRIANGRPIIFKLHPREHFDRAIKEIQDHAPESMIYTSGDTNAMVANCEVVVATYSTVILSAAAMGKKVYSDFYSQELLEDLMPIQTGGTSARTIANLGVELIEKNVKKMSLV